MKKKLALIYGGKSGEHEVSLQTAYAVMNALDYTKYTVHPFYITQDGHWHGGDLLTEPLKSVDDLILSDQTSTIEMLGPLLHGILTQKESDAPSFDVVFPLLHGTYGEDGTIQGFFEMAQLPYVGSGVLASAVGMDKVMMKKVFAQAGLPQCVYRYFTRTEWIQDQDYHITEIEVTLGYPCFVKPANLGSSVGISKAKNREELIQAVETALQYDHKVIVEEFIDAREVELSVLGNEQLQVSVPGEIIVSDEEFYDFHAKYTDGKSQMVIPAPLPEETVQSLQEMAEQAYRAIDGSGLSRVDFFIRKEDQALLINEINTMPGFTPYSMYPLLWEKSGKPYAALLDELIELALERYNNKNRLDYKNF